MAKKKNTMEIDLYSRTDGHEMSKKEYSEILIKQNYERKLDNAYNLPWSFNNTLKDTCLDDISGVRECFDENRYLSENLTVKTLYRRYRCVPIKSPRRWREQIVR